MKINLLSLCIPFLFLGYCKTSSRVIKNQPTNCFNDANFQQVRDYVQKRVLSSSSGMFFIEEYPADKNAVQDGIKRPSQHPENVYQVHYDLEKEAVFIKNNQKTSYYTKAGLTYPDATAEQKMLVNEFFCHLFRQSAQELKR